MTTKSLFKILSNHLVLTFFTSSLCTFITYSILSSRDKSSLEGRQADFIQAIAGIFWILVLTISSLPIYFNLKSIVRQKRILSFISFFFLPILVTIIFWLTGDKDAEWLSFYIATSYFLSVQFISYLLFIRRNKSLLRTISN